MTKTTTLSTYWTETHDFFARPFFQPPQKLTPLEDGSPKPPTGSEEESVLNGWIWSLTDHEPPHENTPFTDAFLAFRNHVEHLLTELIAYYQTLEPALTQLSEEARTEIMQTTPLEQQETILAERQAILQADFNKTKTNLITAKTKTYTTFFTTPHTTQHNIRYHIYVVGVQSLKNLVMLLKTHTDQLPPLEQARILGELALSLQKCSGGVNEGLQEAEQKCLARIEGLPRVWLDNRYTAIEIAATHVLNQYLPANRQAGNDRHLGIALHNSAEQVFGLHEIPDHLTPLSKTIFSLLFHFHERLQHTLTIQGVMQSISETMLTPALRKTANDITVHFSHAVDDLEQYLENTFGPDPEFKFTDLFLCDDSGNITQHPYAALMLLHSTIKRLIATGYFKPATLKSTPYLFGHAATGSIIYSHTYEPKPEHTTLKIVTGPYPESALCYYHAESDPDELTACSLVDALFTVDPSPALQAIQDMLYPSLFLERRIFNLWSSHHPEGPYLALLSAARQAGYTAEQIDTCLFARLQVVPESFPLNYHHNLIEATLQYGCPHTLLSYLQKTQPYLRHLLESQREILIKAIFANLTHISIIQAIFERQLEGLRGNIAFPTLIEWFFSQYTSATTTITVITHCCNHPQFMHTLLAHIPTQESFLQLSERAQNFFSTILISPNRLTLLAPLFQYIPTESLINATRAVSEPILKKQLEDCNHFTEFHTHIQEHCYPPGLLVLWIEAAIKKGVLSFVEAVFPHNEDFSLNYSVLHYILQHPETDDTLCARLHSCLEKGLPPIFLPQFPLSLAPRSFTAPPLWLPTPVTLPPQSAPEQWLTHTLQTLQFDPDTLASFSYINQQIARHSFVFWLESFSWKPNSTLKPEPKHYALLTAWCNELPRVHSLINQAMRVYDTPVDCAAFLYHVLAHLTEMQLRDTPVYQALHAQFCEMLQAFITYHQFLPIQKLITIPPENRALFLATLNTPPAIDTIFSPQYRNILLQIPASCLPPIQEFAAFFNTPIEQCLWLSAEPALFKEALPQALAWWMKNPHRLPEDLSIIQSYYYRYCQYLKNNPSGNTEMLTLLNALTTACISDTDRDTFQTLFTHFVKVAESMQLSPARWTQLSFVVLKHIPDEIDHGICLPTVLNAGNIRCNEIRPSLLERNLSYEALFTESTWLLDAFSYLYQAYGQDGFSESVLHRLMTLAGLDLNTKTKTYTPLSLLTSYFIPFGSLTNISETHLHFLQTFLSRGANPLDTPENGASAVTVAAKKQCLPLLECMVNTLHANNAFLTPEALQKILEDGSFVMGLSTVDALTEWNARLKAQEHKLWEKDWFNGAHNTHTLQAVIQYKEQPFVEAYLKLFYFDHPPQKPLSYCQNPLYQVICHRPELVSFLLENRDRGTLPFQINLAGGGGSHTISLALQHCSLDSFRQLLTLGKSHGLCWPDHVPNSKKRISKAASCWNALEKQKDPAFIQCLFHAFPELAQELHQDEQIAKRMKKMERDIGATFTTSTHMETTTASQIGLFASAPPAKRHKRAAPLSATTADDNSDTSNSTSNMEISSL